jgi:hypothetical protein
MIMCNGIVDRMPASDGTRGASLVDSIYHPTRSTVAECLARWAAMSGDARERCYLVIEGDDPGSRMTLSGPQIENLARRAASLQDAESHACANQMT